MASISKAAAPSATQPAFALLGYERVDELLGKDMHHLMHHTRADGTPFPVEECPIFRTARTGKGVHVDDEVLWRANGTSFPAEYWCYPQWKGQEVVGTVVAFFDITARKLAEAALASVSGKLIEAQEQERRRIARELHDDIGQRLALLAIELAQLQQGSSNPSEVPWPYRQSTAADLRDSGRYSILVSRVALIKTAIPGSGCGAERLLPGIQRAAESGG